MCESLCVRVCGVGLMFAFSVREKLVHRVDTSLRCLRVCWCVRVLARCGYVSRGGQPPEPAAGLVCGVCAFFWALWWLWACGLHAYAAAV